MATLLDALGLVKVGAWWCGQFAHGGYAGGGPIRDDAELDRVRHDVHENLAGDGATPLIHVIETKAEWLALRASLKMTRR